jgi:hypothetical protein
MNWEWKFYRGTLSNSANELYATPPNKKAIVTAIDIVNRSGAVMYLYVYLLADGDSTPSVGDALIYQLEIPVPTTAGGNQHCAVYRGWAVVDAPKGGSIYAYTDDGSGNAVDCTISICGVEKTVKSELGTV